MSYKHQAQKIYDGRASFEFHAGRGLQYDSFRVVVSGHIIAECEDSEVADFICKAWNAMAAIQETCGRDAEGDAIERNARQAGR